MVSTRRDGRRSGTAQNEQKSEKKMNVRVKKKENGKGSSSKSSSSDAAGAGGRGVAAEYEEKRAQRMKENMERMKKLGILDLSKELKSEKKKPSHKRKLSAVSTSPAIDDPPRRSSRSKDMAPVNYSEVRIPKDGKEKKNMEIHIEKGSKPEIYTEEHEKLLGDSKTPWTLYVDGYDQEGQRIYDPYYGKSCHQCRQKTLGHRTKCSKCKLISGQFCGDCLYMRYGENMIEVNENPDWICPVCRGICNCSRCRRLKGWEPTGSIYTKVQKLGFKSVAHYLIQPYRSEPTTEESATENLVSGNVSSADKEDESSDATPMPSPDDNITDIKEKERQFDSEDASTADASVEDFAENDDE